MSHETDTAITGSDGEILRRSGQDAVRALSERERELDERVRELRARDRDLVERGRASLEREQELDERRRKLVARWADVDYGSQGLREQSHALDLRRQDLGVRHNDLDVREKDLADKLRQLDEAHTPTLHANITALREETGALGAQLSANIDQYNLDYDGFLAEMEQQLQLEEQWLPEMAAWVADRRQHNVDVNQRNAERRRIAADRRVLDAQRGQLMQDIRTFIGPYEVDETVRQEKVAEISQRLRRSDDEDLVGSQFELLCVDVLRAMSFRVTHEGGTNDGGIDIRAEETARSGEVFHYIIQCKYKGNDATVGRSDISKFAGDLPSIAEYDKAVFVTAGRFEVDAAEHAEQRGISLWDGVWLCRQLIAGEVGFTVRFSTAGHDVQFDDAYWDELIERAAKLRSERRRAAKGP